MLNRLRCYLLIGVALTCGVVVSQWPGSSAVALPQDDPRVADLRERLVSGLKVRTDGEREFIEKVIQGVENRTIPLDLVDSSFLWVRSNKAEHNFPFFYFERVLRLRGKRVGVTIPPYEYPAKSP